MAMGLTLLQSEHQRVALAISRLGGCAREWALTCGRSVDAAFLTWDQLNQQLSRVFAPPNQAYHIRSKFLATRQGKKDLLAYVQELRTLIAGKAADPLPELVSVTVFMEGLRVRAARTEVFRVHPNAFGEAVDVTLNAVHNFRSARPG
uniref:Putative polyprotein n=1 Tax=Phytophthora infestans TaxID=4787 RepID=Q572E7_PHYIN|nr:putative polyprotein [Phytophthora infestans]